MTKRPVAFRVPRMDCAGTHASTRDFRLFSDEGEARAAAEELGLEYEGLYVVSDRASPMTDLDRAPSSIRDDSICESSLHPNKSSGDIVERLRSNPYGSVHIDTNAGINEPTNMIRDAAEIERLRREVENLTLRNSNLEEQRDSHAARALTAESAVAAAWEEAAKIAEREINLATSDAELSEIVASAIRAAGAEKTAESGDSPSTHNSESE